MNQDPTRPDDSLVSSIHQTETLSIKESEGGPVDSSKLERGSSVGRYLILDFLGSGGMGVVYAAYDPELDRRVAVKLLHAHQARRPRLRARLRREAQALARLRHPNALGVYDVGGFEEHIFLAMELVRGTTLKQWLAEQPRSVDDVLAVFLQAGSGLEAAHRAGVVHRDFKASNVMVDTDGRAVVVDFGLAQVIDETAAAPHTLGAGTTEIAGTPVYMAPEQFEGRQADAKADQFSFCVSLYEALYGCRPFPPLPDGWRDGAEIDWTLRPTARLDKAPKVRDALVRGLAVDPVDRFPSLAELLVALRRSPQRRSGWPIVVTLALLAAGIPVYQKYAERRQLCSGGPEKLVGIWDNPARSRLEQVFRGSEELVANSVWPGARSLLDTYRDDWLEMYDSACRATHFRGEQSAELLDLRMGCLDQRRRELSTLVHLLARDGGRRIEDAVDLAGGLSPLAGCADVVALTSPMKAPDEPRSRELVAALRGDLAEAKILHDGGELEEAATKINLVLEQAESLQYWPLIAEATLRLGRLQETRDPAAAEAIFRDALAAAEAGRHDRIAVDAFGRLARAIGVRNNNDSSGLRHAALAEALLAQLGHHPDLEASIAEEKGSIHFQQGRWELALMHYRQALEIEEKAFGQNHPSVARTLTRLGNAHREQGELDQAQAAYRRALTIAERAYGSHHPYVAAALNRLASVAVARGDPLAAEAPLRRALEIRQGLLGPNHPHVAISLITLGNVLTARGEPESGYESHRRALIILEERPKPNLSNVAIALIGMATAAIDLKRLDEASRFLDRALKLQTAAFGDNHPRVAATVFNQGILYKEQRRFDLALESYSRALAIWRRLDEKSPTKLAAALTGIGHVLTELGRPDEAVGPLEQALAFLEKQANGPGPLARTRYRLARALEARGEPDRARQLGRLAVDEFRQASARYRALLDEAVRWLGEES